MRLKVYLVGLIAPVFLVSAGAGAIVASQESAQASTGGSQSGSMTFKEYDLTYQYQSLGTIQNDCGCTGAWTRDGDDEWVVFTAANSTFALDICKVGLHFHQNSAGTWKANPVVDGKERITCGFTVYQDNYRVGTPA